MKDKKDKNYKAKAIEFYRMAFTGKPRKAVEQFVGKHYIQHNPLVKDGKSGFIEYFEQMARDYPDKDVKFVRSVEEGNLVALHTHQTWKGEGEYVTMDFFRFDEEGKIVEHWDTIQTVPGQTANGNPMY